MKRFIILLAMLLAWLPAFGALMQNQFTTNAAGNPLPVAVSFLAQASFSNTTVVADSNFYPNGIFKATSILGTVNIGDFNGSANSTYLNLNDNSRNILFNAAAGFLFSGSAITGNGGGLTNLQASQLTGTLPASALPSVAVTNSSFSALCLSYNIPQPTAWYDLNQQRTNNGAYVPTLYDQTGNGYTMWSYNNFANSPNTYSTTAANGMPAVWIAPAQFVYWTKNTFIPTTNFTVFLIYKDVGHNSGGLFGSGSAGGGAGLVFEPYFPSQSTADTESKAIWSWANGNPSWGIPNAQSGLTEMAVARGNGSISSDPSFWQDGMFAFRAGMLQNPSFTAYPYLTNLLAIGSALVGGSTLNSSGDYFSECLIYTNALSDSDVARVEKYLQAKYSFPSQTLTIFTASEIGDYATPGSNWVQSVQQQMPTFSVLGCGISGLTAASISEMVTNSVSYPHASGGAYALIYEGGNDTTIANITNYIVQAVEACNSNGVVPILATLWSQTNYEINYPGLKTNYNNWVYSNSVTYGYKIADFASDPFIGPNGSYSNVTYYVKNNWEHPATNTYPLIIAPDTVAFVMNAVKSPNVFASYYGNGSGLTNLNVSSLSSGNISSSNQWVGYFTGNGAGLSNSLALSALGPNTLTTSNQVASIAALSAGGGSTANTIQTNSGGATLPWLTVSNNVTVASNLVVNGTVTFNGTVQITNSTSLSVSNASNTTGAQIASSGNISTKGNISTINGTIGIVNGVQLIGTSDQASFFTDLANTKDYLETDIAGIGFQANNRAASTLQFQIKEFSNQTTDLLQVVNSSGVPLGGVTSNGVAYFSGFSSSVTNSAYVNLFTIGASVTTFFTNLYGRNIEVYFSDTTVTGIGKCATNGGAGSIFVNVPLPLTGGTFHLIPGATASFTNGLTATTGAWSPDP